MRVRDLLDPTFWDAQAARALTLGRRDEVARSKSVADEMRARSGPTFSHITAQRALRRDDGDTMQIGVRFEPWVPSDYWNGFQGLRTLVVMESFYAGDAVDPEYRDPDERNFVRSIVISCAFQEDFAKSTWTRVRRVLDGREASISIWNHVAVHEFVQDWISGSRVRPTQSQWATGAAPFLAVLEALQPDVALILGREAWTYVPQAGEENIGSGVRARRFGNTLVAATDHPAAWGFAYKRAWEVMTALREASRRHT